MESVEQYVLLDVTQNKIPLKGEAKKGQWKLWRNTWLGPKAFQVVVSLSKSPRI